MGWCFADEEMAAKFVRHRLAGVDYCRAFRLVQMSGSTLALSLRFDTEKEARRFANGRGIENEYAMVSVKPHMPRGRAGLVVTAFVKRSGALLTMQPITPITFMPHLEMPPIPFEPFRDQTPRMVSQNQFGFNFPTSTIGP